MARPAVGSGGGHVAAGRVALLGCPVTAVRRGRLLGGTWSCNTQPVPNRKMSPRRVFLALLAVAVVVVGGTAVGLLKGVAVGDGGPTVGDDWVVVTYSGASESSTGLMDALEGSEREADQALQRAEAGAIEGNDVGDNEYQLYFVGADRDAMWGIVQPILERAPVKWDRVRLMHGVEDPNPRVITR